MKSGFRLRNSAEFERVRAERRAAADRLLRLQACPNDLGHPRVGITVAKRVGGAVVRNRIRRRLREAVAAELGGIGAFDLVLIAAPAAAACSYRELTNSLRANLDRLRVVAA